VPIFNNTGINKSKQQAYYAQNARCRKIEEYRLEQRLKDATIPRSCLQALHL